MPTAQAGNVDSGNAVTVLLDIKVPVLGSEGLDMNGYDYAGYVFNGWCTVQPEEDQATGYQTCPDNTPLF